MMEAAVRIRLYGWKIVMEIGITPISLTMKWSAVATSSGAEPERPMCQMKNGVQPAPHR